MFALVFLLLLLLCIALRQTRPVFTPASRTRSCVCCVICRVGTGLFFFFWKIPRLVAATRCCCFFLSPNELLCCAIMLELEMHAMSDDDDDDKCMRCAQKFPEWTAGYLADNLKKILCASFNWLMMPRPIAVRATTQFQLQHNQDRIDCHLPSTPTE